MASAFGHAFAAIVLGTAVKKRYRSWKLWVLGILCSIIPDADIIAFKFGIPYEHMLGHRGISHSILFAFLLSVLIINLFHKYEKSFGLFMYYFVCTISHGILDAMTTRGKGVAFFAPFDNDRYFLPWRMIKTSPLDPASFFSKWGLEVLKSEALYIGIPALILLAFILVLRKG